MRISRQPTPVTIKIDQKQLENVKYIKYLGSMLTDDGRCTCEIKFRIDMEKDEFNLTEGQLTKKFGLNTPLKMARGWLRNMSDKF
jgi:hypothetical protein